LRPGLSGWGAKGTLAAAASRRQAVNKRICTIVVRTEPSPDFPQRFGKGEQEWGKGVEKMATIEEVVEMWDKTRPNSQTETLKGKNVQSGGKIGFGPMYESFDKWAVIKLVDAYPFTPFGGRICYAFDSKSGNIEINFQRKNEYPCNTEKLYDFLNTNFNGKEINGKKLTLISGRINYNNLTLGIKFDINSTAKEICDCMEKLIKLTQKPICNFFKPDFLREIKTLKEINDDYDKATANSLNNNKQRKDWLSKKEDKPPETEVRQVKFYKRDYDIRAETLANAKGTCAKCSEKAPFVIEHGELKGQPYLEIHHKKWLSEGGKDTTENTVALCPNCHKEEHYGKRHWN
jgi:5-methylcytosine-specific restriction endonuclease McrA